MDPLLILAQVLAALSGFLIGHTLLKWRRKRRALTGVPMRPCCARAQFSKKDLAQILGPHVCRMRNLPPGEYDVAMMMTVVGGKLEHLRVEIIDSRKNHTHEKLED